MGQLSSVGGGGAKRTIFCEFPYCTNISLVVAGVHGAAAEQVRVGRAPHCQLVLVDPERRPLVQEGGRARALRQCQRGKVKEVGITIKEGVKKSQLF